MKRKRKKNDVDIRSVIKVDGRRVMVTQIDHRLDDGSITIFAEPRKNIHKKWFIAIVESL